MNKYTPRQRAAQDYMRSVLMADRRIQALESEIERQRARLGLNGIAGGESVSRTTSGDAMERGFADLDAYCRELDTDLIGYVETRREAMRAVEAIGDRDLEAVLSLRYFEGFTFATIARCMHVSDRLVYDIHAAALTALASTMPREWLQSCSKLQ